MRRLPNNIYNDSSNGLKLRHIRLMMKITQKKLAKILEVPEFWISHLELGKMSFPDWLPRDIEKRLGINRFLFK